MPPFDRPGMDRPGMRPGGPVRAAFEIEHMANAAIAASATAAAIQNAQAQAQAQASTRQAIVQAIEEHCAALGPLLATMSDAMLHLTQIEQLVAELV